MALVACVWAQAPAQAPAPQTPPAHHGMHHDMAAMHEEHMQQMKDQVAKMRATLEQMKANLTKVKDPAVKQQSQLDIDLWEGMVKHMEGMVSMMSQHEGMGMMGGTHHDVDEKATPPASDSGDKQ